MPGPQHMDDALDDLPQITTRSAPRGSGAGTSAVSINFFSLLQTASGNPR